MDVLRLGLIGCGVMGRSLSESAASLDSTEMIWVSDVDEDKCAALASDLDLSLIHI